MGKNDRRRSSRSLRRRRPSKKPRKVVLILCEGEKTEPNYFKALRSKLGLSTVEVEVAGTGAAPISVIDAAQERQKARKREAKRDQTLTEFDEIWCVVDIEVPEHKSLGRAIDKAHQLHRVELILSNPCFEFWYLLHFAKTGTLLHGCADVLRELKKHLPRYEKGDDHFQTLDPKTDVAIRNAKSLFAQQWQHEEDLRRCNPCTEVYKLVERLREIVRG